MPVCLARLPPAAEKTEESSLALLDGIVQEMWSDISAPIFFLGLSVARPSTIGPSRPQSQSPSGGMDPPVTFFEKGLFAALLPSLSSLPYCLRLLSEPSRPSPPLRFLSALPSVA